MTYSQKKGNQKEIQSKLNRINKIKPLKRITNMAMNLERIKENHREHTKAISFILLSLTLHCLLDDYLPGIVPPSLPVFDAVM